MQSVQSQAPATLEAYFQAIFASLLCSAFLIALPTLFSACIQPARCKQWFHLPRLSWRNIGVSMGLFLLLYGSTYLLYIVLNPSNLQENIAFISLLPQASWTTRLLLGCFMCLLVPLAEECLYRGVLLQHFSPMVGLIMSTLFFGLAHGINGYLYPILLMGWGLGMVALTTRSIWPTFLLHGAFNGYNFLMALATMGNGA
jgi:membrane protease YdiL (CAAX protease family)